MDSELDPFGDAFDEPTAPRARPAGKFQPKARPRKPKAAAAAPPPRTVSGDAAKVTAGKVTAEAAGGIFSQPDVVSDLGTQPTSTAGTSVHSTNEEPKTGSLDRVASDTVAVDDDSGRLRLEFQESGAFHDVERTCFESDSVVASENPHNDDVSEVAVEPLVPPPESSFVDPSETRHESEGMGFDDFVPSAPAASEVLMSSEQTNYEQTCVLNVAGETSTEDVPDLVEKESGLESPVGRKSKTSSIPDDDDTSGGKFSMQLRKRSGNRRSPNETENVRLDINSPAGTGTDGQDIGEYRMEDNEDTVNGEKDGEYRIEEDEDNNARDDAGENVDSGGAGTSKKKRASKKSKKPAPNGEKPVRKRNRAASNASEEQPAEKQVKKFSHTSRRKRRHRNLELLKVPEDEIDTRNLPMKDLIFLAEHKEQLAIKDAKASQTPSTDQGVENANNEVDNLNSDDEVAAAEEYVMPLFNSHSFSNRTRTMRWSKQETELFYEGIRQFGTDLSMITQLFPERTRRQIKNKFKNEERRKPFLLSEALANPREDDTYYKKVYDRLAEAAGEEERDLPLDLIGEAEPDSNRETNEEARNSEQGEPVVAKDSEENNDEAPSTEKVEEEEEEEMEIDWSLYESVV